MCAILLAACWQDECISIAITHLSLSARLKITIKWADGQLAPSRQMRKGWKFRTNKGQQIATTSCFCLAASEEKQTDGFLSITTHNSNCVALYAQHIWCFFKSHFRNYNVYKKNRNIRYFLVAWALLNVDKLKWGSSVQLNHEQFQKNDSLTIHPVHWDAEESVNRWDFLKNRMEIKRTTTDTHNPHTHTCTYSSCTTLHPHPQNKNTYILHQKHINT